jgi:hypothetical protein
MNSLNFLKVSRNAQWHWLLVGLLLLLHWSCATRQACERRWGPIAVADQRVVTFETRDTTLHRPGAQVQQVIAWPTNMRSGLGLAFARADTLPLGTFTFLPQTDTITVTDSTGRAQLRWWQDAYGQLVAQCQARPDSVQVQGLHTTRTVLQTQTVRQRYIPWYWRAGVVVLLVLLGLAGMRMLFR